MLQHVGKLSAVKGAIKAEKVSDLPIRAFSERQGSLAIFCGFCGRSRAVLGRGELDRETIGVIEINPA